MMGYKTRVVHLCINCYQFKPAGTIMVATPEIDHNGNFNHAYRCQKCTGRDKAAGPIARENSVKFNQLGYWGLRRR